jgi:CheY-like chemotaxis protein
VATQQTVLVVDDEEEVRRTVVRMLEGFDFAVAEADNGGSALLAARRLNGTLRLVVTDIDMPVMNGLEFARTLWMMDPKVPVVFITDSNPVMTLRAGLKAEVLRKPFGVDTFLGTVTRLTDS